MEKCGRIRVRFRGLGCLGAFWEGVRLIVKCAEIEFSDRRRDREREEVRDMRLTETLKLMT